MISEYGYRQEDKRLEEVRDNKKKHIWKDFFI